MSAHEFSPKAFNHVKLYHIKTLSQLIPLVKYYSENVINLCIKYQWIRNAIKHNFYSTNTYHNLDLHQPSDILEVLSNLEKSLLFQYRNCGIQYKAIFYTYLTRINTPMTPLDKIQFAHSEISPVIL